MAANAKRLVELSMVPALATEVAKQINTGGVTPPAPIETADATDEATTQALVNECKDKINELIAAFG